MKNRRRKQSDSNLSSKRTGEEFWENLMKKPYNEDKVGQAFVIVPYKRQREPDKPQSNNTDGINEDKVPDGQQSNYAIRDDIEKLFPDLEIVDGTEEMIGKTTLFTWKSPLKV
ncbi:MAG TPA: hypothetical protein PLL94_10820 [Bacteroidales bacterium]|nr:hypothetical protein [Bacteroidales bacterium]HQK68627.1 hypothetical protein [Bacteroidales bacterium]